jgi:hypothetical protein
LLLALGIFNPTGDDAVDPDLAGSQRQSQGVGEGIKAPFAGGIGLTAGFRIRERVEEMLIVAPPSAMYGRADLVHR